MKYWTDKETGIKMCEPDCADEWLELIQDIAFAYDGCGTVKSLMGLIDEMVEMTAKARICLKEGKIFTQE